MLDACLPQGFNDFCRFLTDGVMNKDSPCQILTDGKINPRVCTVHSVQFSLSASFKGMPSSSKTKCGLPITTFCLPIRSDAVSNHILHFRVAFLMEQTFFRRLSDDGASHTVREMFFQTCRCPQHFIPFIIPKGNDLRNLRTGFRQSACLVKIMVSAAPKASRCLPPLTIIRWFAASRMAEMTAMGVASLMAQE